MSISRSTERAEADLKPIAECQSQTIYQSTDPPNRPRVPSEGQQWENCQTQGFLPAPPTWGSPASLLPFPFSTPLLRFTSLSTLAPLCGWEWVGLGC